MNDSIYDIDCNLSVVGNIDTDIKKKGPRV